MPPTNYHPNPALQDLALILTVNCVRNTVIETYHAAGKLSDLDMKACGYFGPGDHRGQKP